MDRMRALWPLLLTITCCTASESVDFSVLFDCGRRDYDIDYTLDDGRSFHWAGTWPTQARLLIETVVWSGDDLVAWGMGLDAGFDWAHAPDDDLLHFALDAQGALHLGLRPHRRVGLIGSARLGMGVFGLDLPDELDGVVESDDVDRSVYNARWTVGGDVRLRLGLHRELHLDLLAGWRGSWETRGVVGSYDLDVIQHGPVFAVGFGGRF